MSSPSNPLEAKVAEVQTSEGLLDQIVAQGRFGRDVNAAERGKDLVKEFINQVLDGKMALTRDAEAQAINQHIRFITDGKAVVDGGPRPTGGKGKRCRDARCRNSGLGTLRLSSSKQAGLGSGNALKQE